MDVPDMDQLIDQVVDAVVDRLAGGGQLGIGLERTPLPDIRYQPQLRIAGVELTQAIQHHDAAGRSYGDDNSVPLVALKPLVARVYPYVRPGATAEPNWRVSGELTLSVGNKVVYRTGPTRQGGTRVGPVASLDRNLWDRELTMYGPMDGFTVGPPIVVNPSLNFRVPAWYCRPGRATVSVRLWVLDDGGAATGAVATAVEPAHFNDVRAPKIAMVRVNWTDSAGTVHSPSDADMLADTRLAERMLPFPYFQTTILGVEVGSTGNFAAVPATTGGCNQAWLDLVEVNGDLYWLRVFAGLFELGTIVYGMVADVPGGTVATSGTLNTGCRIDTAAGIVGHALSESTFAHELGHYYGCGHTGVAGATNNDPNYPNYGGSTTSIGEVGIDPGAAGDPLYPPKGTGDIMSYEDTLWISPYTYRKIFDARTSQQSASADPNRVRPLLLFGVRLHRNTQVELSRSYLVKSAAQVPPRQGRQSPLSVDLLDGEGQILATRHLVYVPAMGGGCGCGCDGEVPLDREPYIDLADVVEWDERVVALSFHRGGEPLGRFEVGEAPTVKISEPEREDGRLVVTVRARHPRVAPSVVVLFTADDGVTFVPVAIDPAGGKFAIDEDRLPGGPACWFRAVATAELQSATADTRPFESEPPAHRVHLVAPSGECRVTEAVALSVLVDQRGAAPIGPADIQWRSSIDGNLGVGFQLVTELSPGRHEVVVSAPDGRGGVATDSAIIVVGG